MLKYGERNRINIRGRFAGNVVYNNAISISDHTHWNGSGPIAFGGVDSWPHVTMEFSFPEGCEDLSREFCARLETMVRCFIHEKELDE